MSAIKDVLMNATYTFQALHPCYTYRECEKIVMNNHDIRHWYIYADLADAMKEQFITITFELENNDNVVDFISMFRTIIDANPPLADAFDHDSIFFTVNGTKITVYINPSWDMTAYPVQIDWPK